MPVGIMLFGEFLDTSVGILSKVWFTVLDDLMLLLNFLYVE